MEKAPRVLLVGDVCKDVYHYASLTRENPEFRNAPLYSVQETRAKMGMAGNVLVCLQQLNINVVPCLPEDPEEMSTKTRIIDMRTQCHFTRIDEDVQTQPLNLDRIKFSGFDIVVISDYNKGYIREETIAGIKARFTKGPIFVDTKKTDLAKLRGCIVKVNLAEAKAATSYPPDECLIVTKGDKGASWMNQTFPALPAHLVDPCGAGDAFLAGLVYGHIHDPLNSIKYGIVNAGICVEHSGVYAPTREQLIERMKVYDEQTLGQG